MNIEEQQTLFLTQYYGQDVAYSIENDCVFTLSVLTLNRPDDTILLLRSIEKLTDEEMIQVSIMSDADNEDELTDAENLTNSKYQIAEFKKGDSMPICFAQYLLRIGILLPFTCLNEDNKPITLSPDELIKLGWAKIQTS